MIRSVWVGLNLVVATVIIGSMTILAALARVRDARVYDWASRGWSRWILRVSGAPVYVEGLHHVRGDVPQVITANHVSWYDVFALASVIPKRFRFIAKKELAAIPIFGTAWKVAGHVSIDRSDRSAAVRSLDEAGRRISEDNSSVVIFPEGTRSYTDRMRPFKKGAFMLAIRSGVDIVPVAVAGTRHVLPRGAWRVRSGPIIVRFGEPVRPADYGMERRDELIAEVRRRIVDMRGELEPLRRAS